jgi:hypothetical protein
LLRQGFGSSCLCYEIGYHARPRYVRNLAASTARPTQFYANAAESVLDYSPLTTYYRGIGSRPRVPSLLMRISSLLR